MNKEKANINVGDIKSISESFPKNGIPTELKRFIDNSIKGKIFHSRETIEYLKNIALPFFDIKVVKFKYPNAVSQFQEFISSVAKAQPDLFKKESEDAQRKVFTIMSHPMEFVKYLFPNYSDNLSYLRTVLKSKELSNISFNLGDSEIPEEKIGEVLEVFDSITKREITGSLTLLNTFIKNQDSKKENTTVTDVIDKAIPVVEEQQLRRKLVLDNPTEFGRNILRATGYTQSHIEYFFRYIRRLVHIKNKGNRKFRGMYYRYGSTKFWDDEFRKRCKKELKDFKELKSFLIRYSKEIKKLRNINAHQVPGEITLSKDYKNLVLQEIGKKNKTKVNYTKLCETIISYGILVNKIELHPENRYDKDEDTIGIQF